MGRRGNGRGISTVLGTLIFVLIISSAFTSLLYLSTEYQNYLDTSYEVNKLDFDRALERLSIQDQYFGVISGYSPYQTIPLFGSFAGDDGPDSLDIEDPKYARFLFDDVSRKVLPIDNMNFTSGDAGWYPYQTNEVDGIVMTYEGRIGNPSPGSDPGSLLSRWEISSNLTASPVGPVSLNWTNGFTLTQVPSSASFSWARRVTDFGGSVSGSYSVVLRNIGQNTMYTVVPSTTITGIDVSWEYDTGIQLSPPGGFWTLDRYSLTIYLSATFSGSDNRFSIYFDDVGLLLETEGIQVTDWYGSFNVSNSLQNLDKLRLYYTAHYGFAGLTPNTYNPISYNLIGSTSHISGAVSALGANDGSYTVYKSYATSFSTSSQSVASAVYMSNTGSGTLFPKARDWDGSLWSTPESELATAGSPVRAVRIAYSTLGGRLQEKIVITLSDDGFLDAYVWNGVSWSVTNNIGQVWSTSPSNHRRPFDVAYEKTSGEALLVYGVLSSDSSRDLAYRTWDGQSWSTEAYIDDTTSAIDIQYYWITLASYPLNAGRVDEIALIGIDGIGSDVNAWIWSGNAWGNFQELTSSVVRTTEEDIAVAYEQISGDAMFIWGNGNALQGRKWAGSWQSQLPDVMLGAGGGGIGVDSVTANAGDSNSFTHSHSVSGSERLLVVSVNTDNGINIASVTFGGQSLTLVQNIVHSLGKPRVAVYMLIDPPTGSNNVVVTLSGGDSDKTAIGAISYTGVDQTTPIDGVVSAEGSSNAISITVTSESGDLVQDAVGSFSTQQIVVGAGQTERWNLELGGPGASGHWGAGSTEAGAASVDLSWSGNGNKDWVIAGFNINLGLAPDARWFSLKADSSSNRLMTVITNSAKELQTVYWSGSSWTINATHDMDIDSIVTRVADFAWEPQGGVGLLVWGTSSGSLSMKTWTTGSGWSVINTISASGMHDWIQLHSNPRDVTGDVKILGLMLNDNDNLGGLEWDGTTLTNLGDGLYSTDTTTTKYESFHMTFRNFGDPIEYSSEVEFLGPSILGPWGQLDWMLDSAWDTQSVSVTVQLFNYKLGRYAISGENGYISYISSSTSDTDEIVSQTISTIPMDFRDTSGDWKVKILGVKSTSLAFQFKGDLFEYKPYTSDSTSEIAQTLYLYDFTAQSWVKLWSSNVSTTDISIGPLVLSERVRHYVEPGSGEVRLRIYGESAGGFIAHANYMHLEARNKDPDTLTLLFSNQGPITTRVVSLWIDGPIGVSHYDTTLSGSQYLDQYFEGTNGFLLPGESKYVVIPYSWSAGQYVFRAITSQGSYAMSVGED